MFFLDAKPGVDLFTIEIGIVEDDEEIGKFLLIPQSIHLYQIHLSSIKKEKRGHTVKIVEETWKFCFDNIPHICKIIAMIPTGNRTTVKLAKDSGMQYEGLIKESHFNGSCMEDLEIYSIQKRAL